MKRRMNTGLLIVLACCFAGCVTTSVEYTDLLFASIPDGITKQEAIKALYTSAIRREWQVSDAETDDLEIKLNHRNYKAVLNFSFSDTEIRYSDHTQYFSQNSRNNATSQKDGTGVWKKRPAPDSWIVYLQRDIDGEFRRLLLDIKKAKAPSTDPIADKLISLKKLFDQDLITEAEYQKKRAEILSEY